MFAEQSALVHSNINERRQRYHDSSLAGSHDHRQLLVNEESLSLIEEEPSERQSQQHLRGRNEEHIGTGGREHVVETPTSQNDVNEQCCPLNKKYRVILCVSIVAVVVLLLIIAALMVITFVVHIEHPHSSYHQIEDNNAILVSFDSSVTSSINITLSNPTDGITAVVYLTSTKPNESYDNLPQTTIPELNGKSRYNYNYYGADQPIYLLPNSQIIYIVNVSMTSTSTCPARLFLFNDESDYMNFMNYISIQPYARSSCLMDPESIWLFNITEYFPYCVAIEIDDNVSIQSNVSVVRAYYNTTGLEKPKGCDQALTIDHPYCQVKINDSYNFHCRQSDQYYLLVSTTDNAEIVINYSVSQITGCMRIGFVSVSGTLTLVVMIITTFLILLITRCCCWLCKNGEELNDQIENYENNIGDRPMLSSNRVRIRTSQYSFEVNEGKT